MGSVVKYKANKKINKKQLCRVLVITSKKNILRKSGSFIKFDENRGVILADMSKLLSTRVFGPISREVKRGVFSRLLSIAKKVV